MILFEKKYQTFDTVFHHQMKHCVSCLIYYFNIRSKERPSTFNLDPRNKKQTETT